VNIKIFLVILGKFIQKMKKKAIILILGWVCMFAASGQVAPQKYFIEFMDKTNSPYSVNSPAQFLSYRAIERRQKQGIPVVENDIPVNQSYINRLKDYSANVLTRSKWFNGVTIYCLNPSMIDSIMRLPFVKRVIKSQFNDNVYTLKSENKFMLEEVSHEVVNFPLLPAKPGYIGNTGYDYGPSYNQIHMLKGDSMHKLGFRGEGMVIAVLDAGFLHVDVLPAFDSLRLNNQILGTMDFVTPGNNVYNEYEHGMEVLSCMGGNLPGQLIGTAPKASFWLLRSEDVNSENLIEEYNWVSAAEFADSAGADIINSSLGYTVFEILPQSHTCLDMNGHTTPVTKGANIASGKGMLVINSAGNSGAGSWKCVSSPADGYTVLAVAAVDSNGIRAGFSSVGEATLRIKPNVAAMGRGTVVSSTSGTVMYNNGTSFSSPVMAGMAACLWQAAPTWNNTSISRAIELSGNQAANPDSLLGYGIPDFIKALQHVNVAGKVKESSAAVFPNPFAGGFSISFHAQAVQEVNVYLVNNLGMPVYSLQKRMTKVGENLISFPDLTFLPDGNYILRLVGNGLLMNSKVIKINN
jgi:serine protease AprX